MDLCDCEHPSGNALGYEGVGGAEKGALLGKRKSAAGRFFERNVPRAYYAVQKVLDYWRGTGSTEDQGRAEI